MCSTFPVTESRRFKRVAFRKSARLVVNLVGSGSFEEHKRLIPCLILDSSPGGFRLKAIYPLRRGQVVEVVQDGDPLSAVPCNVAWVGKTGEVGLERCRLP